MKDVDRIYRICHKLSSYWEKVPEWRFGQLIENFKNVCELSDLFYMEDYDFEKMLDKMFKYRQENDIMSLEFKILKIKNRIALLESRTQKENYSIVKKLKRQLRNLEQH